MENKHCTICGKEFSPNVPNQIMCSSECRKKRRKSYSRKSNRKRKEERMRRFSIKEIEKFKKLADKQQFSVSIEREKECEICGSSKYVVMHHVKYIPIEIVWLCRSCHDLLHRVFLNGKKCLPIYV